MATMAVLPLGLSFFVGRAPRWSSAASGPIASSTSANFNLQSVAAEILVRFKRNSESVERLDSIVEVVDGKVSTKKFLR